MKVNSHKISDISVFISLILLALALRLVLFYIPSTDILNGFGLWYDQFNTVSHIGAYRDMFYNYSPAYLYIIDLLTLVRFIPRDQALKIVPVLFDFVAAFAVLKLVEIKYPKGIMRYVGFFIILFSPTVFIESGMWGQCDSLYTAFLLWALYFILKEKPFYAILFFSVAFAFKLQAIFFAPIFIILFLRRKFPVYLFLVIPLVYFVSVIPAWLAGGPLGPMLTMYFFQIDQYHALTLRAPNIYMFIDPKNYSETIVWIGLVITGVVVATYLLLRWRKWKELDNSSIYFDIVFFTLLIPFFLPKMHERYFFTAGIFLILLAIHEKNFIGLAVLMQVSALLSYIPYLAKWPDYFAQIGAVLNCILIIGLFFFYRDYRKALPKADPTQKAVT